MVEVTDEQKIYQNMQRLIQMIYFYSQIQLHRLQLVKLIIKMKYLSKILLIYAIYQM